MFPVVALGADLGLNSGLSVNRTVIASQTTPTSIKTTDGAFYGLHAMTTGGVATPVYVQYFTSASSTIGVTAPFLEFCVPLAGTTFAAGLVAGQSLLFTSPVGIPMSGGINIAASSAMSSGPAIAAASVIVYTFYA